MTTTTKREPPLDPPEFFDTDSRDFERAFDQWWQHEIADDLYQDLKDTFIERNWRSFLMYAEDVYRPRYEKEIERRQEKDYHCED